MKERPILFSGHEVRAILAGRKTQKRWIVKPQPTIINRIIYYSKRKGHRLFGHVSGRSFYQSILNHCPHGQPGDRLWVRETWATGEHLDSYSPALITEKANDAGYTNGKLADLWYQADDTYFQFASSPYMFGEKGRWRPSIHMPRWASRIDLEITNIRIERLQDIREEDAIAEGINSITKDGGKTYKYGITDRDGLPGNDDYGWNWQEWEIHSKKAFSKLWESINWKGSWDENPWVWVVELKRIK